MLPTLAEDFDMIHKYRNVLRIKFQYCFSTVGGALQAEPLALYSPCNNLSLELTPKDLERLKKCSPT